MSKLNAYALNENQVEVDGRWVPARPESGGDPLMWRIREAWEVLRGRRHTVYFPFQEPKKPIK